MFRSTLRSAIVLFFLISWSSSSTLLAQPTIQAVSESNAIWSTVPTDNDPTERHENGFVAYDGKLYLLGGRGSKPVEIFDPATGSWSTGDNQNFQMHHFQAVVFNDLIYVVGAYTGTCCDAEFGLSHVWTYNPQTNNWSQGHEIPVDRRRGSTGAVVYNDKIYIVGGLDGGHGDPSTAYKWFDEYDPVTGQWKVLPDAPRVRDHFHAVVSNGRLYLTAGRNTSVSSVTGAPVSSIDVYNFTTNSWSTLDESKNIPTPRGGAASVLYQGKIMVIGGETSSQTLAHNETEAFDPITETWETLSPLVVGRHGSQAAVLDNAVYLPAGAAQKGGSPELDSMERFEDTDVQLVNVDHSLSPGWNLIGLPLNPVDNNYAAIYDDVAITPGSTPLGWDDNSGYVEATALSIGNAYWMHLENDAPTPQTQTITGVSIDAIQVQLVQGWNMVSGPSCDDVVLLGASTDPAGAIPEGAVFSFDEGYVPAYSDVFQRGQLNQGLGYWIFASNSAIMTLQCGGAKTRITEPTASFLHQQPAMGSLHVSDAAGRSQRLFFDGGSLPGLNPDNYNLPPLAYKEYFDARYPSNRRMIEGLEGYVRLQGTKYPFTFTFESSPRNKNGKLFVSSINTSDSPQTWELRPGDKIEFENDNISAVHVHFVAATTATYPTDFTLRGNYPNPFNPTTRIVFDLAEQSDVAVIVFDLLGRQVKTLNVSDVPAGRQRSIVLDAAGLPAGAYVYKVTAVSTTQSFTQMGRMVLLK